MRINLNEKEEKKTFSIVCCCCKTKQQFFPLYVFFFSFIFIQFAFSCFSFIRLFIWLFKQFYCFLRLLELLFWKFCLQFVYWQMTLLQVADSVKLPCSVANTAGRWWDKGRTLAQLQTQAKILLQRGF